MLSHFLSFHQVYLNLEVGVLNVSNRMGIASRCDADMVFEMSGQVTLIGKARREGDLRDRHPCSKQVPCTVDAHLGQISVWWQTYLGTECPDQGERVELSNGSKLIERNRLCVIGMQIDRKSTRLNSSHT